MEYVNRVKLRGRVGSSSIKVFKDGVKVNRFSVCTVSEHLDGKGHPVVENTWHQCSVWSNQKVPDVTTIGRDMCIEIEGRLRAYKYPTKDGGGISGIEVVVYRFKILPMN